MNGTSLYLMLFEGNVRRINDKNRPFLGRIFYDGNKLKLGVNCEEYVWKASLNLTLARGLLCKLA